MENKTKIDVLSVVFLFTLALVIFLDLSWLVFGIIGLVWILCMIILVRSIKSTGDEDIRE